MTTTVKIEAHVAQNKEVRVMIRDTGAVIEKFVLQNGESAERYIYDGKEISVLEQVKEAKP